MTAARATFASDDTEFIENLLQQSFGKVSLSNVDVTMAADVIADKRWFFGRYAFTGRMSAVTAIEGFSVITSSGGFRWEVGTERGDVRPFLQRDGVTNLTSTVDATFDQVHFEAAELERTARAMYADDGLRVAFLNSVPIGKAADRLVTSAVEYALASGRMALQSELINASLYRYLAAVTLESFALIGDREVRAATTAALREGHRRAVAFIDDFASLPITLDDIAEAASLTSADLHAAFRSHSAGETSVQEHLRAVRLDAAHRDLVAADPTAGDTVRAIALRWGFSPSRLAVLHRETYGTTPKWTLDR